MSLIIAIILGFFSIMLPGFFVALALLRKTELNMFEIAVTGFILGMILPPAAIWLESYLIPYAHIFSFSGGLYNANIIVITIIGILLSIQQGALNTGIIRGMLGMKPTIPAFKQSSGDYKKRIAEQRATIAALNLDMRTVKEHEAEEEQLRREHREELDSLKSAGPEERSRIEASHSDAERRLYERHEAEERMLLRGQAESIGRPLHIKPIWFILLAVMLLTFGTRIMNISKAPSYFEFDPYFDMLSTQNILTYGYQIQYSHEAWPTLTNGTVERLQPLVPYLEAYWYDLAGGNSAAATALISNSSTTTLGITHTSNSSVAGAVALGNASGYSPPNTTLLSLVSSWYPPIMAALLVFVIFVLLYHLYGDIPAIIGAALAATMPTLLTTFIAGEQLLEPWGIFAMFFFVTAYLLAVKYPDNKRLAVLAGIAFAANFLGAHYYTVTAGILALFIVLQGTILVLKRVEGRSKYSTLELISLALVGIPMAIAVVVIGGAGSLPYGLVVVFITSLIAVGVMKPNSNDNQITTPSFYKMNAVVLIVIIISYVLYSPYGATLTERTPSVVGIPIIIALPLFSLILVAIFDFLPMLIRGQGISDVKDVLLNNASKYPDHTIYIWILIAIAIFLPLVIGLTPVGKPIAAYITLSKKFTTPSSPLFMTVQEYAPTGAFFNFGANGFGPIAFGIANTDIIVWVVLIAFLGLMIMALYGRQSQATIFLLALVLPLMIAGMSEVKYMPHLGVAYVIAIGVIFGEVAMLTNASTQGTKAWWVMISIAVFIILIEAVPSIYGAISAYGANCTSVANSGNSVGYAMYCNNVPNYWLAATAWMRQNVGPYAPRILAWWDYGDWINWFGNSNAVIRGDNSVPTTDYHVAAEFVMGAKDGYNATTMGAYMNSIQAKYVLYDDQLVPKWGALDFLACVYTNQTSYAYAILQGKQYGKTYVLGTSPCEINHDPAELIVPYNATINEYCSSGNSTSPSLIGDVVLGLGSQLSNQTYCMPVSLLQTGNPTYLLNPNGTKTNILVTTPLFEGLTQIQGQVFYTFILIYAPNGPNDTITDAPSEFYQSNYYKGYFLGHLPGFTRVYPANFTGINYVNSTSKVVIYALNNYTGGNPPHTAKPSWIKNNYTVPG